METAPRLDSFITDIMRGRNAWAAVLIMGIVGFVPLLNFAVLGYACFYSRRMVQAGNLDFDKPDAWEVFVRDSFAVGLAALAYAGLPWYAGHLAGGVIDRLSAYNLFETGRLLSAVGGVVGLAFFGAAFTMYMRSGRWESFLQFKNIAEAAKAMVPVLWLPILAVFGCALVTAYVPGFGLAVGLFFYSVYLSVISQRLPQG